MSPPDADARAAEWRRSAAYLIIPAEYVRAFGGLAWDASTGEAVLRPQETTFAFARQIGLFLEGFASARPLIHFGHVLHALNMLEIDGALFVAQGTGDFRRLVDAWRRGHVMRLHNAGALFASLSRGVPAVRPRIDAEAVVSILKSDRVSLPGVERDPPELTPEEFERQVGAELARLSDEDLDHWLRHGGPPVAPVDLAPPPGLAKLLADWSRRPRLAGAARWVESFGAIVQLPPRAPLRPEQPEGGYVDLTHRGPPERLLIGQLALDDDEFVRRAAHGELLYYRIEEPRGSPTRELLVMIDQGVRTWGSVRLMLSAGALSLGRLALREGWAFRLAGTSNGGEPLDPRAWPGRTAELIDASDLSEHPARSLAHALTAPHPEGRDVVLLTHPKSAEASEVMSALRSVPAGTRLFVVTIAEDGALVHSEASAGALRPRRVARLPRHAPAVPKPTPRPGDSWTGSLALNRDAPTPNHHQTKPKNTFLAFDASGRRVLVASRAGHLALHDRLTDTVEVLPLGAFAPGRELKYVDAICATADGFAVLGRDRKRSGRLGLLHYFLEERAIVAHDVPAITPGRIALRHNPGRHAVTLEFVGRAIHEVVLDGFDPERLPRRQRKSWDESPDAFALELRPDGLLIFKEEPSGGDRGRRAEVLETGRAALMGAGLLGWRAAEDVLVVCVREPRLPVGAAFRSFAIIWTPQEQTPGWLHPLGRVAVGRSNQPFAISSCGRWLATIDAELAIHDLHSPG